MKTFSCIIQANLRYSPLSSGIEEYVLLKSLETGQIRVVKRFHTDSTMINMKVGQRLCCIVKLAPLIIRAGFNPKFEMAGFSGPVYATREEMMWFDANNEKYL